MTLNRKPHCRSMALTVLCGLVPALAFSADKTSTSPDYGAVVNDFTFTDIRYLPRRLSDFGEPNAFVLVFTTLDCPIVRRSLPKLRQLDQEFHDRGVQFVSINVGLHDALVDVANQAVEADLGFPFAKDFTGQAVAAVAVTRTPECVVLDADRRLKYRGRIDSEYRLGGVRPHPGRLDLREAILDVLAGREVRVAETSVDGCLITPPRDSQSRGLTYYEDVAPLIQKHCRNCHQPDNVAPFSLLTLEDVDSHASMIAEVVRQRRMPPWHAASKHGNFINSLSLPYDDLTTIVDWATGDRKPGVRKHGDSGPAENHLQRESDWLIGEPDLVIRLPAEEQIPAEGYIPYRYALLPYIFLEDTWVQRIEINPGNDAVVHHCNMGYANVTDLRGEEFHPETNFITGFVPGGDPMILDSGIGFCIPAGSVIGLQLHYVTTGEETTDRTSVGFVFAREKIQKQIRHFQCRNGRFAIPPGAGHHEVRASRTFQHDATGIGLFCHMHLRGKDMVFAATYPDGRQTTLLSVPNYNFEWQSSYRWPAGMMKFARGTRIDCTAHFDNSRFNPFNPDPTVTVRHGLQTWHEMMYGFLFFTHDDESLNLVIDPKTGYVLPQP